MKRIRVMLLTLVLSISMLAPEFSMLPAVYAQDETPAVTQTAAEADSQKAPETASQAAPAEGSDAASPAKAAEEDGTDASAAADDAATATDLEGGDQATDPAADPALGADQNAIDAEGNAADTEAGAEDPATGEAAKLDLSSYDKFYMTDLNEAGAIKFMPEAEGKITVTPTEYGNGLLFTGTVADLNSTYINLGYDFNFDEGSIGRLTFDGLKDKDRGMSVEVEVYLDDSKSPASTFALKKQMGKKEWANDGEMSFSMGESEITGKHSVSLLLKITGKKDTAKTSVMLRSLQFCKTTIPVMYFNIDESEGTIEAMNSSEDHSVECYGTVDLIVPDTFKNDETFADEYGKQDSVKGLELEYIRGRGNSTWGDDKKPYKVKFDKGQNLFGFGKNKHWVLLANRYDNSFVRNRMTYWLGQQLGMEYTPQCVPVEVVMNGEFYGSYLLCEQIRVGTGRVTIDDLDDEDPLAITDPLIETGGYLLSMDYEEDEKRLFETENGMRIFIESPDDNVAYFSDYIKAFTQKVENAIFAEDFKDADGHPYSDYLDMDAAVDYWWVQEFSCNGDAYGSGSTYLYKKRDSEDGTGKLYWGPLWDFDYVAWGDLEYDSEPSSTLDYTSTPWFEMMKADPEFVEKVRARWSKETDANAGEAAEGSAEKVYLKDKLQEITKEGGRLDMYLQQMETSYKYDHDKWGAFDSDLTEYKGEIEQLRSWIDKRIAYVDEEVKNMKVGEHTVRFEVDGKIISTVTVKGILREKDFPKAPTKKGYTFMGWFDEEQDLEYSAGSRVMSNINLSAYYVKTSDLSKTAKIFFKNYDVYVSGDEDEYYGSGLGWYFQEARVVPDSVFSNDLTWTSSNEEVAVVGDDGDVTILAKGDTKITATLKGGISKSYNLHVVSDEDMFYSDDFKLSKKTMKLKVDEYDQVVALPVETPTWETDAIYVSTNEKVATVDDIGIVHAVGAGTAKILVIGMENREIKICKVTVEGSSKSNKGRIVKRSGNTYKITSDKKGKRTAMLIKARNASVVTIPAAIKIGKKKYVVNKIKAKAFAKSKATRVGVKTKKLTKASVKNSLRGSKVRKIKVKVGNAKANRKIIKKYKKIFTQKNAGKGVVVS